MDKILCRETASFERRLTLRIGGQKWEARLEGDTDVVDLFPLIGCLNEAAAAHRLDRRFYGFLPMDRDGRIEFFFGSSAEARTLMDRNVEVYGVVRYEAATEINGARVAAGASVLFGPDGYRELELAQPQVFRGQPCARGKLVFDANELIEHALSQEADVAGVRLRPGTVVFRDSEALLRCNHDLGGFDIPTGTEVTLCGNGGVLFSLESDTVVDGRQADAGDLLEYRDGGWYVNDRPTRPASISNNVEAEHILTLPCQNIAEPRHYRDLIKRLEQLSGRDLAIEEVKIRTDSRKRRIQILCGGQVQVARVDCVAFEVAPLLVALNAVLAHAGESRRFFQVREDARVPECCYVLASDREALALLATNDRLCGELVLDEATSVAGRVLPAGTHLVLGESGMQRARLSVAALVDDVPCLPGELVFYGGRLSECRLAERWTFADVDLPPGTALVLVDAKPYIARLPAVAQVADAQLPAESELTFYDGCLHSVKLGAATTVAGKRHRKGAHLELIAHGWAPYCSE